MQARIVAEEVARSQSVLAETLDRSGLLDTAAESAALHRQYGARGVDESDAGGVSGQDLEGPVGGKESGAREGERGSWFRGSVL